jgi:hypothetical protein
MPLSLFPFYPQTLDGLRAQLQRVRTNPLNLPDFLAIQVRGIELGFNLSLFLMNQAAVGHPPPQFETGSLTHGRTYRTYQNDPFFTSTLPLPLRLNNNRSILMPYLSSLSRSDLKCDQTAFESDQNYPAKLSSRIDSDQRLSPFLRRVRSNRSSSKSNSCCLSSEGIKDPSLARST